mmetsp:Transcript_949/g.1955  ORF Transcript_949/g.1955 Transcript_949/m.1955 type:complete len:226 (+) Transcript_949:318-995(+)
MQVTEHLLSLDEHVFGCLKVIITNIQGFHSLHQVPHFTNFLAKIMHALTLFGPHAEQRCPGLRLVDWLGLLEHARGSDGPGRVFHHLQDARGQHARHRSLGLVGGCGALHCRGLRPRFEATKQRCCVLGSNVLVSNLEGHAALFRHSLQPLADGVALLLFRDGWFVLLRFFERGFGEVPQKSGQHVQVARLAEELKGAVDHFLGPLQVLEQEHVPVGVDGVAQAA